MDRRQREPEPEKHDEERRQTAGVRGKKRQEEQMKGKNREEKKERKFFKSKSGFLKKCIFMFFSSFISSLLDTGSIT